MSLSRQPSAPRHAVHTASGPRVFRYRYKVDGCTMWYAKDPSTGRFLGVEIIRPGMDECAAIARLVRLAYGPDFGRPGLRLVTGDDGVSSPRRLSAAALAGVCRAHRPQSP